MITPPPFGVVASVGGWLSVGTRTTTFCWFKVPVPSPPTVMLNARFSQITLLYSSGKDTVRQDPLVAIEPKKCPGGQITVAGRLAVMFELFWMATIPAG